MPFEISDLTIIQFCFRITFDFAPIIIVTFKVKHVHSLRGVVIRASLRGKGHRIRPQKLLAVKRS